MKVVAFTGLARSGKSSLADYLVRDHGFVLVRFAGPLKTMLSAIGLSVEELDGTRKEMSSALLMGRTVRHAMQTLGSEWGRDCIHPDFWVGLWQRVAYDVLDHGGCVVVDDCRFANEAAAVRALGGKVIRLMRAGAGTTEHVSEHLDFDVDYDVSNNGPLSQTCAMVADIIAGWRGG